ncbi:uncharacterized protein YydD (DUF2326 family) [Methanococcus voltae PS]|uniref:Uncharacterized protein YydD (DUF2326 family) n=1 Tax=Methanococcus voltae PS TaxID=523842 RepID=A0ABT2EX91_METVO|nr:DUF2326 domain-containing protein [Methanococcus voltae]MCS3922579.1 uncharacterized protein YydD (DUF2326 family) [Methanococcus voltae PS]
MIKSLRCNQPSFKTINFKEGFNVILADTTKSSKEKDSRNGVGKSTLIEIIHFCLGNTPTTKTVLKDEHLKNWIFTLDFELSGNNISVSRNTGDSSKVIVNSNFSTWPIKPSRNKEGKYVLKNKEWIEVLGNLAFGLTKNSKKKYYPTFRSLISYFSRRSSGAYLNPFKHHPNQKEWDIQTNNAYLLGLNYNYVCDLQLLKDKKNTLNELKKASKSGILTEYFDSKAELENSRVRLNEEIEKLEEELSSFKVHPQYYEIEKNANKLTEQIHELVNNQSLNNKLIMSYQKSTEEEKVDTSLENVLSVYEEAGVLFPERVTKRVEQYMEFHKTIISNRKKYLSDEIQNLQLEVTTQSEKIAELTNKRAVYLDILKSNHALDEHTKLSNLLSEHIKQRNYIVNILSNLDKFEKGSSTIKIENEKLHLKLMTDYDERKHYIDKAIKIFNENSNHLYSESGNLLIDVKKSGYKFDVSIKRTQSQGISYMKVFCYDMTLIELWAQKKYSPKFLIHDSTIFDGVDERQVYKALELAMEKSKKLGFQYICTMNSDNVPYNEFSREFKNKFEESTVAKFTDSSSDGGLLGIRF